ncbi:MAG: putative molybdenum carrier protein [Tatlockia sp.]|nr:putative molybdenum carrier protein [Tatlockia sp.]
MMIKKIVSGGQTGVDQAAFLIAKEMGIDIGGWCPKGGLDEKGENILNKYFSLNQATTMNPEERTKLNIKDSDGTLIIVPTWPLAEKLKDGTTLTIEYAQEVKKPFLIIRFDAKADALPRLKEWIDENDIKVLNIAGPRESNHPGIYKESCEFLRGFFAEFNKPR